jgi:hypothetical protein
MYWQNLFFEHIANTGYEIRQRYVNNESDELSPRKEAISIINGIYTFVSIIIIMFWFIYAYFFFLIQDYLADVSFGDYVFGNLIFLLATLIIFLYLHKRYERLKQIEQLVKKYIPD